MLKIAIVDDEQYICSEISEFILNYSMSYDVNIETACFNTCEQLIESLDENRFDIVFLDIQFGRDQETGGMSGIDLGRNLLKLYANDNTAIIYVTSYEKYAIDAIKTRAFDFIKKPVTYEKVRQALNSYLDRTGNSKNYFQYIRNNTVNSILTSNITYLESRGRKVYIHTLFNVYEFYARLSDLTSKECFKDFIRIHKSYFINRNFVERFTPDTITLIGRESLTLPISKSKKGEVKEHLLGK